MSTTPKMTTFSKTTRWTSPEPTGFEKKCQDIWDEKRDTQVKTFMRYDNKKACLNFAMTLKRAADDYMARVASGQAPDIITVYGSYKIMDAEDKKAEAFKDGFLRRLGVDDSDYITKYLDERNIAILRRGHYSTGCMEFTDGSLGVISPTTGFQANKPLKDIHSIETFYCYLKMLPPKQFADVKKSR